MRFNVSERFDGTNGEIARAVFEDRSGRAEVYSLKPWELLFTNMLRRFSTVRAYNWLAELRMCRHCAQQDAATDDGHFQ